MMAKVEKPVFEKVPGHIAIIMDGNGRWARARGLPHIEGHRAGTENLRRVIKACVEFGVQYLTIYAFSTENWIRPKDEIQGLMQILENVIDRELDELDKEGVQLRHIGRIDGLGATLQKKVEHAIERTKNNKRLVLCIAWNYGGRDEIVHAVKQLIEEKVPLEQITEDLISQHLFTKGIPDPDLVVRTSGEYRVSNFLIWQSSYSEWYFTPTLWPDFDREEMRKAIEEYSKRERRFGGRIGKESQEGNYAG